MVQKMSVEVSYQPEMMKRFPNRRRSIDGAELFKQLGLEDCFRKSYVDNKGLVTMDQAVTIVNECVRKSKAYMVMV